MPPWMAGAAIGLAILTMATGAITLGTTLALSQATLPK
jgi:Na+/serine symporter